MNAGSEPDLIDSLGEFVSAWDFSSPPAVLFVVLAGIYLVGSVRLGLRGGADRNFWAKFTAGFSGFSLVAVSLAGPLDFYSGDLFAAHMSQHIVLSMFAAPLLLIARPMPAYMWAFPQPLRTTAGAALTDATPAIRALRLLTNPVIALPLFIGTLWGWHIPPAYNASLESEWLHLFMHFTMFTTAMLFWWPIVGPPPVRTRLSYPQRIIFLTLAVTPTAVLAAIITFSNSVIYDFYLTSPGHFNWSPTEDQRVGGLLMWIPGNFVYLTTMTILFFMWFNEEERDSYRKSVSRSRRRMVTSPQVKSAGRTQPGPDGGHTGR